jgi:hypothetical protein
MKGRNMLRVAYNGSWFNNLDDTLVWDSPLRLDDSAERARPRADGVVANQLGADGERRRLLEVRRRTQLTGFVSYGFWNNDQPLQPFTINSALPEIRAPASDRGGRGSCVLDQPEPGIPSARRLAVRRPRAALRLRQPDAGDDHHGLHRVRHVAFEVLDRWP